MYHSEKYTRAFLSAITKLKQRQLRNTILGPEEFEQISLKTASSDGREKYFETGRVVFTSLGLILIIPALLIIVASISPDGNINIITFLGFWLYLMPLCIGISFGFKINKKTETKKIYATKNLLRSILCSLLMALFSFYLLQTGLTG